MRESTVEKNIRDYAIKCGMLVFKFSSPGQRGVPDRLFVTSKGTVWFMEVKKPGKTPTELQDRCMNKLRARGLKCVWTDNPAQGRQLVDEMRNQ